MAPFALAHKTKRFHNFFNASRDADHAFKGTVPRAYAYCHEGSWVVHKYPWRALQWVDDASQALYCSRDDFMRNTTSTAVINRSSTREEQRQQRGRNGGRSEGGTATAAREEERRRRQTHVCWDALRSKRFPKDDDWPAWKIEQKFVIASAAATKQGKRSRHASPYPNRRRPLCDEAKDMGFFEHVDEFECK
jgi:hypothetical protein